MGEIPSKIEEQRKFLWSIGKCGSLSKKGSLCTITANHRPHKHQAQVMEPGPDDGLVLEEWDW